MKNNLDNYDKEQARLQKLVSDKVKDDAIKEVPNPIVPPPAPEQPVIPAPVVAPTVQQPVYDENSQIVNNVTTVPNTVIPPPAPVYDENNPSVAQTAPTEQAVAPVVQPEVQQPSEADALMQRLYSIKEPVPVIDQAKIDRLQRMGKINGIAQSANILGDMLALGLGANVRKRQPDRNAPMIYQQYEGLMDRNKAEKDAWNLRDTQNTRNNLIHGISEVHRKEAEKLADARLKAQSEHDKLLAEQNWKKFTLELGQKDRDSLERNRHNLEMERSARIRASKTGASNKEDKPVKISTANKTYELKPEEVNRINNEMVGDPAMISMHPDWFDKKEIMKNDGYGAEIATGEFTYKPKPNLSKTALAQAYLELQEKQNFTQDMGKGTATPTSQKAAQPTAKKDWNKYKE